jgi:NAD(P)H-nitrite reductase large subunit
MAEVVARNLTSLHQSKRKLLKFKKADTSTKLKLLGVNVASFGDYFADEEISQHLVYRDPFSGIYKVSQAQGIFLYCVDFKGALMLK